MGKIHQLGPKIIVITDGPKGAYASDGVNAWFMPIYPDPKAPISRTGAGDAFASTFVSALALGKSIEEALTWAPINSMSVVQYIGAQKGLLTLEQLQEFLAKAPTDYKPRKI
jgi:ribokinase